MRHLCHRGGSVRLAIDEPSILRIERLQGVSRIGSPLGFQAQFHQLNVRLEPDPSPFPGLAGADLLKVQLT
jgi:hypothetical protein